LINFIGADAGRLLASSFSCGACRMPRDANLFAAKLPLYLRLGSMAALVVASTGLCGTSASWFGQVVIFMILLRRWARCHLGYPSRSCVGHQGKPLTPTIQGLHHRFVDLYGAEAVGEGVPEVAALKLLQTLSLDDGQHITFWDVGPRDAEHVVLLINGLGARVAGWTPLLDALHTTSGVWQKRRLVIPEYRGQFGSVPLVGGISVERSAADVAAVVASLAISKVTVLSWSTGVQVGLQLALDKPDLVERMVLIQGTTGEALGSISQLPCTIPGMPLLLSSALKVLPRAMNGSGARNLIHTMLVNNTSLMERVSGLVVWLFGSDITAPIAIRYVTDMMQSDEHFANYCGYALALGRHVIAHSLPDITCPVLVVTGAPDFVTPARCSYDLAALLGGETRLVDDVSGSHYYIFEEPHKLAREIVRFLDKYEPVKRQRQE